MQFFLNHIDNSIIKINAEVIEVFLDDQGLPWESKNKPTHVDL